MNINQNEKTKLYDALALFQNAFRSYIVKLLRGKYGDDWLSKFKGMLYSQQLENWERNLQSSSSPESSIDFQHFKSFALNSKDLTRNDFGNKTNDLPTWLGEIVEVRNKIAHFDEISRDEAIKAWINLRTISRIIGEGDLEREISNLEESKLETNDKSQNKSAKRLHQTADKSDFSPLETLDIVNCAKEEFREMVLSHNVYICPAKDGSYNHKRCKYIGIYWEKHVGAVGEIEAVIDVYSENRTLTYWINGNKDVEDYVSRAKEKALQLRPDHLPVRVFLIKNLHSTNLLKDSLGGMFGSKIYMDIGSLDISNSKELADALYEKKYSDFGK